MSDKDLRDNFAGVASHAEGATRFADSVNGTAGESKGNDSTKFAGEERFSRYKDTRSHEKSEMENNRLHRLDKFHGDIPKIWYAYGVDYFYVYENLGIEDYKIIYKQVSTGNNIFIDAIRKEMEDGTVRSANSFNQRLANVRNGFRRRGGNINGFRNGGIANGNGRIHQYNTAKSSGKGGSLRKSGGNSSKPINPYLPVVHTFTDITGQKRDVIRLNGQFYVERENAKATLCNSIEEAVKRENETIINRYARKKDHTPTWVKQQLAEDPDFLKKAYSKQKFSLENPVEQHGDLIALHNLDATKLNKSLALGGFPMPSIAVTKPSVPHTNFGSITLVMQPRTVDPKADRRNTVYGADAWTPTFPSIEYEADEKVAKKIRDKYYALAKEHGYDDVRALYSYANALDDQLNRQSGEAGIIKQLLNDTNMMQVYLLDSGKEKVADIVSENRKRLSDAEIEQQEYIIQAVGEDVMRGFGGGIEQRKAWMAAHGAEVRNAYRNYLTEVLGIDADGVENVFANTSIRQRPHRQLRGCCFSCRGCDKVCEQRE